MKRIKIAQIGTSKNSHGNHIWKTLLKQKELFEIAGYAFPENERSKFPNLVQVFEGFREMTVEEILNDPTIEAVTVETEELYLTKYAILAAKAGKHLHMEKPGGIELDDFEQLISVLRSKQLVFSTGYMYRFNPVIQKAMERVKSGELGRIFSVEAHMDCKHEPSVKQWLGAFPGGMMFYLGCHLIDLIYQIQGEPVEVIPMNTSTGIDGIQTDGYGMAVFKYPNGLSFAKTCADECGGFLRRQLVICGEKGTLEIKPMEVLTTGGQYTICAESGNGKDWSSPWKTSQSEIFDRYEPMMCNFAEMVRGKQNPYSYDYELRLYKLILRACGKEV